jgi:alpha-beta hydrolase superfamily lysophospholipase
VKGVTEVESRRFPEGISCRIIQLRPEEGVTLVGFVMAPEQALGGGSCPTVILLHGICSTKDGYFTFAEELCKNGFRVVAFDSRGHGASEGGCCTFGWHEKKDVSLIIDEIRKTDPEGRIAVYGKSMGGAIALQAMAEDKRITCGIVASTFADFNEAACLRARSFTGLDLDFIVRPLVAMSASGGDWKPDEVRPEIAARSITQPVLLLHGTRDEVFPVSQGKRIFSNLASTDKEWVAVQGGGHGYLGNAYGPGFEKKLVDFLRNRLSSSAAPHATQR